MPSIRKILVFWCVTSLAMGYSVCFSASPPLPSPEQCTTCHGVGVVYEEWATSVHAEAEVGCFSCHIPGKKQEEAGLLGPGEKEGFHILGYFNGSGFTRVEGNDVCVRCHDTAHHAASRKAKCLDCEDVFITEDYSFFCPGCSGSNTELVSGRELYVDEIEGD